MPELMLDLVGGSVDHHREIGGVLPAQVLQGLGTYAFDLKVLAELMVPTAIRPHIAQVPHIQPIGDALLSQFRAQ
jgi:hypothetical protein